MSKSGPSIDERCWDFFIAKGGNLPVEMLSELALNEGGVFTRSELYRADMEWAKDQFKRSFKVKGTSGAPRAMPRDPRAPKPRWQQTSMLSYPEFCANIHYRLKGIGDDLDEVYCIRNECLALHQKAPDLPLIGYQIDDGPEPGTALVQLGLFNKTDDNDGDDPSE